MKRIIRLKESELKRIINKSVRKVLKESGVKDGNLEPQFDNIYNGWDPSDQFNTTADEKYTNKKAGIGNKENDNLASWSIFDDVNRGIGLKMKHKAEAAYYDRSKEKPFFRTSHYDDDVYGSKNEYLDSRDYKRNKFGGWMDDIQSDLDKKRQDSLDIDKYSRQADSRPLHRKGSLNRAFDESKIHGIVKGVLKEWADGTDTIQAYHVATVGSDSSSQEEADFAYDIYDALTHNQMTADEAIQKITNGDMSADTEIEQVPRSAHNFGTSKDGKYFLTYDQYTGAFDVWENV